MNHLSHASFDQTFWETSKRETIEWISHLLSCVNIFRLISVSNWTQFDAIQKYDHILIDTVVKLNSKKKQKMIELSDSMVNRNAHQIVSKIKETIRCSFFLMLPLDKSQTSIPLLGN